MIKVMCLDDDYTISDFFDKKTKEVLMYVKTMPKLNDIFRLENNLYSTCCISHNEDLCAVSKLESKSFDDPEESYSTDWVCPYCGYVEKDAWEIPVGNEHTHCPECGSEIEVEKEVEYWYRVKPVKANKIIEVIK